MGLAYAVAGADLTYGDRDGSIQRSSSMFTLDMAVGQNGTLSFGAGASLAGSATLGSLRYTLSPGLIGTVGYTHRVVDGSGLKPFVLLSASIGGSGAPVRHPTTDRAETLFAFDLRGSVTVGKTFYDSLSPYVSARVFGGPVVWRHEGATLTGSDPKHFQLALGVHTMLPHGFDLYAEIAPLGERAGIVGGGYRF